MLYFVCFVQNSQKSRMLAPDEYNLLAANLTFFPKTSAQVKVFHCLDMVHTDCEGVQRIRSYPFPSKQFRGRNMLDSVFCIPEDISVADFDLSNTDHHEKVEYAKVT